MELGDPLLGFVGVGLWDEVDGLSSGEDRLLSRVCIDRLVNLVATTVEW